MNYEELLEIKQEIDDTSTEINKLEGKLSSIMEDLKEHGFNSIDELKQHIQQQEEEVKVLEQKLSKKLEKLEEYYETD